MAFKETNPRFSHDQKVRLLQSHCGLAAVWHHDQASSMVWSMLHAIQHRGSDGAGISSADGFQIKTQRAPGLLSEVFDGSSLEELDGCMALGHIQMAPFKGRMHLENLQPVTVRAHQGDFSLAMGGQLSNSPSLRRQMEEDGLIFQGISDAEIAAHLIQIFDGSLRERLERVCQVLQGAYVLILMTKNTMYLVRSAYGIHTLWLAELEEGGYAAASESCALEMIQTAGMREIQPGEMVILGKQGYESRQTAMPRSCPCAMEAVYYSREDSMFGAGSVHRTRLALGEMLGSTEDIDADIVIGVPDTAVSAAYAFSRAVGKPYEMGLIKNRYIGSTFVRPTEKQRLQGMRVRINAISSIVKGQRVYLVDDSVHRGDTAKRICQLLREAGAKEVHLRIACAPISESCLYGKEYIPKSSLAMAEYTQEEFAQLIQADSVRYLTLEQAMSVLPENVCLACCSGLRPASYGGFGSIAGGQDGDDTDLSA